MKAVDRLLRKAKKINNMVRVFFPMVVPDSVVAERVWKELDEFNGDKPYYAVVISGEDDLTDDAEGVTINHVGGAS